MLPKTLICLSLICPLLGVVDGLGVSVGTCKGGLGSSGVEGKGLSLGLGIVSSIRSGVLGGIVIPSGGVDWARANCLNGAIAMTKLKNPNVILRLVDCIVSFYLTYHTRDSVGVAHSPDYTPRLVLQSGRLCSIFEPV